MKSILILLHIVALALCCFYSDQTFAQTIKGDSLIRRESTRQTVIADTAKQATKAKWDARKLKLSPQQRQIFNNNRQNSNSDFFKPTMAVASDPSLVQDSVYVKAFRQYAYNKALKYRKHNTPHYLLIGGIVAASLTLIALLILIIVPVLSGDLYVK